MSSFIRVAGFGAIAAAAVLLSACAGRQNPPSAGPATTATAAPATTSAQPTKPAQAKGNAPADACASATKATLDAALEADKEASGALLVDSNGLQHIKCAAYWAFARFSNNLDGGSVLFEQRNGKWVPRNWGTGELCEDVPAATAEKICR